jgi:hypothetical protein
MKYPRQVAVNIMMRNYIAFFKHWSPLMEGINLYIPKRKKLLFSPHWWVFVGGFVIGSALHRVELRLWKERKWDKEPGCMIPVRQALPVRVYNYLFIMKWVTFLYYNGLFINEKDLTTHLELEHIYQGRKYRRTLAMEYVFKEKQMKLRDDRYDFLNLSTTHGHEF